MRILLTGAGGFIGSAVAECLVRQEHQVFAVDRSAEALARLDGTTPGVVTRSIDIGEPGAVGALLGETKPQGLIHLAWYADPSDYLISHQNLASLATTNALVEQVLATGCRKIVISGSCVEYAIRDRPLRESDEADPRTLYAACKYAAWHTARALSAEAGAELAWARIFHLHGPGENRRRLLPWVAAELRSGAAIDLTDGTQVRDHLHVADVASGLVALLAPGATGIYNVCSGAPVTLRHVLETLADLVVGQREQLRFGIRPHRSNETMYLAGDCARLRGLGWAPRFTLRGGLEDALRGYF